MRQRRQRRLARAQAGQQGIAAAVGQVGIDQTQVEAALGRERLGLAAGDVESLAGLPEGYFQGKTNVVEFARLKATQKQVDDQPAQGNKVVPFRPVSKS